MFEDHSANGIKNAVYVYALKNLWLWSLGILLTYIFNDSIYTLYIIKVNTTRELIGYGRKKDLVTFFHVVVLPASFYWRLQTTCSPSWG